MYLNTLIVYSCLDTSIPNVHNNKIHFAQLPLIYKKKNTFPPQLCSDTDTRKWITKNSQRLTSSTINLINSMFTS